MSWNITTHKDLQNTITHVTYRRGGDFEDQTAPPHRQDLLVALEALETDFDGWYVGFHLPSPASSGRVTELWAQYPGETVLRAGTVDELRDRLVTARATRNL